VDIPEHYAFVPRIIPPKINYTTSLINAISKTERVLGELKALMDMPHTHRLYSKLIIREAVASSRIEGTAATLDDMLMWDLGKVSKNEAQLLRIQEVLNCRTILQDQWDNIEAGKNLNNNTLKTMYHKLWEDVGWQRYSDEGFRVFQNWIGFGGNISDSKYVPPPPRYIPDLMNDLETFINDSAIPGLLRCAMVHYWFEAIHSFHDGNGRVGRTLLGLMLASYAQLTTPIDVSTYFEKNRLEYYNGLFRISTCSKWNRWFEFILDAIYDTARNTIRRIHRLQNLTERYKREVVTSNEVGLVDVLMENPYTTIPQIEAKLDMSYPGAKHLVDVFVERGMLIEIRTKQRPKVFCAPDILKAITE
jgi:Fic family protein